MDPQRLELHNLLLTFCPNVYFQPPANVKMVYPAIVYARDRIDAQHAGNLPYRRTKRYEVTVIDRDPDSPIPDKISGLQSAGFSRHFVTENLNHDVFTLYF